MGRAGNGEELLRGLEPTFLIEGRGDADGGEGRVLQ